jgi:hypothetical protein
MALPKTMPATGPAFTLGQDIYNKGKGLLSQPIAGNGYNNIGGSAAKNGFGTIQYQAPGQTANPYLQRMAGDVANRTNDMVGGWLNQIRGNSVASGGLGGSRQGVAQGMALGKAADYLSGNLSNMFGQAYEQDANRGLQRYGMDQSFYANQRGQDLQSRGLNYDFWTAQRGQDLAQAGMAPGMIQDGLNTQWLPMRNASDVYSPFTGFGSSTNSTQQGGGWMGALGGGLGVLGLGSQMGWWGGK